MINKAFDDLHIDDFCRDTAKVLISLYKQFPIKSTLYVEDICGPDAPDEFGLHSPRFQAGFNTILWLAETGYLKYQDTVRLEAVEGCVLTHRAFTLLSSFEQPLHNGNDSCEHQGEHQKELGNSTNTVNIAPNSHLPPSRINRLNDTLENKSSEALKLLVLKYMQSSRQYG